MVYSVWYLARRVQSEEGECRLRRWPFKAGSGAFSCELKINLT